MDEVVIRSGMQSGSGSGVSDNMCNSADKHVQRQGKGEKTTNNSQVEN